MQRKIVMKKQRRSNEKDFPEAGYDRLTPSECEISVWGGRRPFCSPSVIFFLPSFFLSLPFLILDCK
jgi:hypothetical protein